MTSDLYVYDGRKKQWPKVSSAEIGFKQVECVFQGFSEPTSLFVEKLGRKKECICASSQYVHCIRAEFIVATVELSVRCTGSR